MLVKEKAMKVFWQMLVDHLDDGSLMYRLVYWFSEKLGYHYKVFDSFADTEKNWSYGKPVLMLNNC